MKNFKKQALAVITMIMLLAAAACNSLSPADNSVGNHESAPTQADGELFDHSEIIDFSELSLASEEISDEISEVSSDESIFESSSEEVSAVIKPLTEQETKIILKVENGRDFEFHDSEQPFVTSTAPMAFFVDSDETAWIFDLARHRNDILVYKNNKLTATINVPDFSTYGGIYMYGDENYIYLVNESDNYFIDGKIWTVNKETHNVTSTVYYTCNKNSSSAKKEYPQYFMTINGNVYLYVSDRCETGRFQDQKHVFYLVNGNNITRCDNEKFTITSELQTSNSFPSFAFVMPENMSGNYTTPTHGQYVQILKVDNNGWVVLNNLRNYAVFEPTMIYSFSSDSELLASAYALPTKDAYSWLWQKFSILPNGKIYRMEVRKGKDFAGIIISRITLGTRIQSAEELTELTNEYEHEIKSPQTSDNTMVTDESISSSEQVNALFPTGITRDTVFE